MITRRTFLASLAVVTVLASRARTMRAAAARDGRARPALRSRRVFAAGPPAAVLVYVLAPDALVGWPSRLDDESLALLGRPAADLPVVGRLAGRGSTVSLETLVQLKLDLVLDVGDVDPTYTSMAERVRAQTGLHYELLAGRLGESAALLRQAGVLLGVPDRGATLAQSSERLLADIIRGRAGRAVRRVYFARGADGLETGLHGSINTEVVEFVGAQNVASFAGTGGLTRISLEQVLAWNPDVIVTQAGTFAKTVLSDPLWRSVAAVRARRVLVAPVAPFGWLDDPPGVNRIIGARWLAAQLDGDRAGVDMRSDARAFYDQFYGIRLTETQLDHLLGSAS
jgi:iron complex transport system substrate-binding protein